MIPREELQVRRDAYSMLFYFHEQHFADQFYEVCTSPVLAKPLKEIPRGFTERQGRDPLSNVLEAPRSYLLPSPAPSIYLAV